MKIAIVGSRRKYLADPMEVEQQVADHVATLPKDTIIISGAADGVDSYAAWAGAKQGLVVIEYPADWRAAPRAAGMIRNAFIIKQADEIHAFWDGESPGTAHMISRARRAGKPCRVFTVRRCPDAR
jgi:YspA, cpYpsA-related SLOG family